MDIRQKLFATFQIELREHLSRIRTILKGKGRESAAPAPAQLEEAFRRAHSLKGAARAVDLRPIETLAHQLETLFSNLRDGRLKLDMPALEAVHQTLDAIEDWVTEVAEKRNPPEPTRVLETIARLISASAPVAASTPSSGAGGADPADAESTVRIGAAVLGRFHRQASRLLEECQRQELVTALLRRAGREGTDFERDWGRLRSDLAAVFRKAQARPEHGRLAHALERIDRRWRTLSRGLQRTKILQQRTAWGLQSLSEELREDLRRARMVRAETVFDGFQKMVRDLAGDQRMEVEFAAVGLDTEADLMVLQTLKDPVMHMLRNAVAHGIEPPAERRKSGKPAAGRVQLRLEILGGRLRVDVSDDGRGIDLKEIAETAARKGFLSESRAQADAGDILKVVFLPGFSTARYVTELSGRGIGLSVVADAARRLQGEAGVRSNDGRTALGGGTTFYVEVPLTVSAHRMLLVSCNERIFGLPVFGIEQVARVKPQALESVEGRTMMRLKGSPGDAPVPIVSLSQLLKLGSPAIRLDGPYLSAFILKSGPRRLAVAVDALLSVQDGLLEDIPAIQPHTGVSGAVTLGDGTVFPVLSTQRLIESLNESMDRPLIQMAERPAEPRPVPVILVVDDSITTRTLEKSLLEANGYQVTLAVDGIEAMARLKTEAVDLVVADIQMPRMDGFQLLEEMKKDRKLQHMPVILVTSLESREDQARGLALGADAYIMKRKFDQKDLLDTLRQIL
ncbi:MAG: hypothetical protein A3G34_05040 [Candidatus Lindowbacteria bacterium RIFCSPLOWO2_12_FULL_62_27]|nr:MAG: hypothetical protein A3G34_05040 [Candidatus Lindowbacteria bacterium RIFCSPLOWO2_12_FULL_62_27]